MATRPVVSRGGDAGAPDACAGERVYSRGEGLGRGVRKGVEGEKNNTRNRAKERNGLFQGRGAWKGRGRREK